MSWPPLLRLAIAKGDMLTLYMSFIDRSVETWNAAGAPMPLGIREFAGATAFGAKHSPGGLATTGPSANAPTDAAMRAYRDWRAPRRAGDEALLVGGA